MNKKNHTVTRLPLSHLAYRLAPIEGISEFAPEGDTPTPEVGTLTIEQARAQEKQKLHNQQAALEAEVKRLTAQVKDQQKQLDAANKQRAKDSANAELEQRLQAMQSQLDEKTNALESLVNESNMERHKFQLTTYRNNCVNHLLSNGVPFIAEMIVYGPSEQAIYDSVQESVRVSKQIRDSVAAEFAAQQQRQQASQPTPEPTAAEVFAPQPQQAVPAPTVTAPAPAPQGAPGGAPAAMTPEDVSRVTSHDAVRNGTYAQNRKATLASLQQQMTPVPQATRAFPMPQAPQAVQPPTPTAPVVQHVALPGGAQQPLGLPTPAAAHAHQVGFNQPQQQAQPQPQAEGQFAVPVVPDPVRAAADAVQRAMADPAAALRMAHAAGARVQTVSDQPASQPQTIDHQALTGPHPMMRG